MADTYNPEVKVFEVKNKIEDTATITLGPEKAFIQTTKWPRDKDGNPCDIGQAQTIMISRQELIGLAYEILQTVK